MNRLNRSAIVRRSLLGLLALLLISGVSTAQDKDKKDNKSSAPPPKSSAPPAHPATTPHPPAAGGTPAAKGAGNTAGPNSTARTNSANSTPASAVRPATGTPAPAARTTTAGPGGSKTVTTASGNSLRYAATGKLAGVTTRSGATAQFSANGRVTSIHTNGMTITQGFRGSRTVVSDRVNDRGEHIRTVSLGARRGFVERPFVRGGLPYLRRTYVVNGRAYARIYRGYYYRGVVYYRYVPAYYYAPAFYGWAYAPWGVPVAYAWGWGPWYPMYGYYFTPYPAYADASLWLTDYLLAANLQAAYDAQAAANAQAANAQAPPPPQYDDSSADASSGGGVALTPEVKQAIADEVKAQLAAERDSAGPQQTAAASPSGDQTPDALDPVHRTFVVGTSLNETVADGSECSLSSGDVLTRIDDTPDANQNVKVLVTSSQKGDCASGSQFAVSVQDLQDMHNHFREQIDEGLGKLAESQGKNGMPVSPSAATTPVADGQAQPDLTAQGDLQSQQQQADQAENDVQQATKEGQGGN